MATSSGRRRCAEPAPLPTPPSETGKPVATPRDDQQAGSGGDGAGRGKKEQGAGFDGKAAQSPEGKGGGRRGPSEPPLSDDEKAVKEMLDRVGGVMQRLPGNQGGPGPWGFVRLLGTTATDADLAVLPRLASMIDLTLEGPPLSDAGMPHLLACKNLMNLRLLGQTFTDQSLATLAGHPSLRTLILDHVTIGKIGLSSFADSDVLNFVDLVNMTMTPEILEGLCAMRKIREIRFQNTPVSEADLNLLRERLPDCNIVIVP